MFTWTAMKGNRVLGTIKARDVHGAYERAKYEHPSFDPKKDRLLSSEAIKLGYGNNIAVADEDKGRKRGKKGRPKREHQHQ